MCGIIGFTGERNDKALYEMSYSIRHRGPDGEGYHFCPVNGVSLAHRRLSITDIAHGFQPMWNEDNTIGIIFNGEIYNHNELRKILKNNGHFFKTDHSDTEVLIHGYEEWGVELLNKLNGMFSFCIYDMKTKNIFIARDRFGEKPLYYTHVNDQLIFASELTGLKVHPAVKLELDSISIQKYFGYGFIPAPFSIYKNIKKLPAGHYLLFNIEKGNLKILSYWQYKVLHKNLYSNNSEEDLALELRSLITSAVKLRLIADVPVGVFLSGGIDSSTILACASESELKERIKTFTIGFKEKEFDESIRAKITANHFGSDHYEEILNIDSAKEIADLVLGMLDEPMSDSSILPTYLLSRFAKKTVNVALGGDGSDELFAGYAPFRALKFAQIYCHLLPRPLRTFILKQVNRLPASERYLSLDFKFKRTLQGIEYPASIWNPSWLSPLRTDEISDLMNIKIENDELYADAIDAWNSSDSEDMISKTSEFYTRFYLQDGILTKMDRASMMVGLETRSPFLDNEVVAFAQRLPHKLKYKNGNTKYILKKAMKGILPEDILRQTKKGFGIPLTKWIKTWPIQCSDNRSYNSEFVRRLAFEHKNGIRDNRLFLWSWIVLHNNNKLYNHIF
jgi:asparagine synthase (glutamine-hydrolysing)